MIVDDVNVPETPVEEEELYSAWALTILCILLILSLWTSYYVQIKRIKTVHETVLSIFAGMVVGLIIRLSPGHLIREMLTLILLSFSVSMALGVAFGLGCSLMLKHSSLTLYPGIESCLVALIAYTSYFFSNGMHMSGIVSLLFCGITLKHYAYHTMSRRTQRTTKYMFSVLAQLSENFIFIYLGPSLFTQDVQISVISTRYAAVFPISELINLVHRARGQRQDELPHSYQMMLFWAGLRGAVGVALAAGFKGENANALRTSVLVVVVLTVILFGGTTARMLEVLGIRTGVEDDDADSDVEPLNDYDVAWGQTYKGRWKRREPRGEEGYSDLWNSGSDVQLGRYGQSQGQPQASSSTPAVAGPSTRSSESSDAEEFDAFRPSSAPPTGAGTFSLAGGVPVTVPTFETLDQRYLLPLFSNPVASRNFHARKAAYRRSMLNLSSAGGERDIGDGGDEDEGTGGRGTPEPVRDLRGGGRLSVPSTPGANSPRFGATRQLGGSASPGLGEANDDARRRRDSPM
ncbi:hypothetical protein RSAG8_12149, partial [Rhizoctonia solani AG-8 WAC10335]